MKNLIEQIEKMNATIAGKQENCRKELITLCEKICEVTKKERLNLHTYYKDNSAYDETKIQLYWYKEEKEFRTKEIDGWENYIFDSRKDNVHIKTKHLKIYLENIQKELEKYVKNREKEIETIEYFEQFVENMKKTEEAI
jgi:hypothetical protein